VFGVNVYRKSTGDLAFEESAAKDLHWADRRDEAVARIVRRQRVGHRNTSSSRDIALMPAAPAQRTVSGFRSGGAEAGGH
jgi:hypothetical protein